MISLLPALGISEKWLVNLAHGLPLSLSLSLFLIIFIYVRYVLNTKFAFSSINIFAELLKYVCAPSYLRCVN